MDTLFFLISKIAWLLIAPDSLLLILILMTFIFTYMGKQKIAKYLMTFISSFLIIIAFFPVGEWLLYPLESHFQTNPALPEKIDGIIVLSGAENPSLSHAWQQIELGSGAERNFAFLALARQFPQAKLVFSGGSGSMVKQEYKAADVARHLFAQQGFNLKRIIFERESRNTYENAIYSSILARPEVNQDWILITTAWHMPRSVGIFCKANWPVIPYPVDHQTDKDNLLKIDFDLLNNLVYLKVAMKEWLGLLAYWITGKTGQLVPNQCNL